MKLQKIAFSFFAVLFSGLSWYFFSAVFSSSNVLSGNGLKWILFFVFLAIGYAFLFVVSLIKDRFDFLLTALLSAIWIPVFLGTSTKPLIAAIVLFGATLILENFPQSLEKSLSLRYFHTSYARILLVSLAILGITSVYLQATLAEDIQQTTFSKSATDYAWPYLGKYFSQFSSDKTVNDYIREQFKSQGVSYPSDGMVKQQRKVISEQVGFPVQDNQKMSELGKNFVSYRFNDLAKRFNFDRVGVYVIFFSLLILLPILRLFFAAFASLLYLILKKARILKVAETEVISKKLEF
jgi:hypothetical protein